MVKQIAFGVHLPVMEFNSSKIRDEKTPGGLGIKGMHDYCKKHNGELEIITGNGYWSSTFENTVFKGGRVFEGVHYTGTSINLTFQH